MGIFKLLLRVRPRRSARPAVSHNDGTPIRSVRRKFLLQGEEYSVSLKPDATRNGLTVRDSTLVDRICRTCR